MEEEGTNADEVIVIPLKDDDGRQRSLFSLKKVVRLGKNTTSVTFTIQDLQNIKRALEDAHTAKFELLQQLRRLQCYRLCLEDVRVSGLGKSVRVLSLVHPKVEVRRAASKLMKSWKRMVLQELFPLPRPASNRQKKGASGDEEEASKEKQEDETFGYDVETARNAPEGEDMPPEELIRLEEEQERYEKMLKKRARIEEDPLMCSSTDDESSENDSDFWSPSMERRRRAKRHSSAKKDGVPQEEEEGSKEETIKAIPPKKELSKAFQKLFAGNKKLQDTGGDEPKQMIDLVGTEDDDVQPVSVTAHAV
ncbi:hypothetical protein M9434_002104 [Picochlorum sp. BPE23]|nr:hypothetical protein M9434_002104 [Picochlorum sp. BPE23]